MCWFLGVDTGLSHFLYQENYTCDIISFRDFLSWCRNRVDIANLTDSIHVLSGKNESTRDKLRTQRALTFATLLLALIALIQLTATLKMTQEKVDILS